MSSIAWVSGEFSAAPAVLIALGGLALLWYALTALHARRSWAGRWAARSAACGFLLPMTTRALPLLLLAITFLFINTEMWQVGGNLTVGTLWLVVVLFATLAVGVPAGPAARGGGPRRRRRRRRAPGPRPAAAPRSRRPAGSWSTDPDADPAAYAEVTGYERWNLILVLVVVQFVQVVLLVAVGLRVPHAVRLADHDRHRDGGLADRPGSSIPSSAALVQVSVFLAAFSGLYLTCRP